MFKRSSTSNKQEKRRKRNQNINDPEDGNIYYHVSVGNKSSKNAHQRQHVQDPRVIQSQRIKAYNLLVYLTTIIILGFFSLIYSCLNGEDQSDEFLNYILSSSSSTSSWTSSFSIPSTWLETSAYSSSFSITRSSDDYNEDQRSDDEISVAFEQKAFDSDESDDEIEPSSHLTMYGDHRVEKSLQSLPKWFQEYIKWNRNVTAYPNIVSNSNQNLASASSPSPKYLILMCLPYDTCGGLSDRFRALAFYVFVAKRTSRVLCIYWTRPYSLETFLEPTLGGIDWRCPKELSTLVDETKASKHQKKLKLHRWFRCHQTPIKECTEDGIRGIAQDEHPYMITSFDSNSIENINIMNRFVQQHSYKEYMPEISQWSYPEMIGDIFRVMFKPVKPLAERINATMGKLGLAEGQYSTVHVRARYPVTHLVHLMNDLKKNSATFENMEKVDKGDVVFEGHTKHYLVETLENAIQCGHILSPNMPMLFISDHHKVTNYALSNDFVGKLDNQTFRPIGVNIDSAPPHLDVKNNTVSNAAEYFGVFEDLLIMGGSKCVSYGVGSFGSFGAGLAGNRCRTIHRKAKGSDAKCPNDRGERKPIRVQANETLFGENPDGKIPF